MALGLQFGDAAFNASADCVFIPVADLDATDIVAADFAAANSADAKASFAVAAIFEKMYQVMSPDTFRKLGWTISKDTITGVDEDQFSIAYTASYSKVVNDDLDVVTVIPVPTSGVNTGLGDFSVTDVFPGAVKVASGATTGAAGVAISSTELGRYTGLAHAAIDVAADSRDWFGALVSHLCRDSDKRSTTIETAIVRGTRSNKTSSAIPAEFTQATDPTSGIPSAEAYKYSLDSRTCTAAVEYLVDYATGRISLNVVTA